MILHTSHVYEECECGVLRDYYKSPAGKFLISKTKVKLRPDFYKKQANELLTNGNSR